MTGTKYCEKCGLRGKITQSRNSPKYGGSYLRTYYCPQFHRWQTVELPISNLYQTNKKGDRTAREMLRNVVVAIDQFLARETLK